MIAVQQLSKSYRQGGDTIRALDGVDLSLRAGEFVSIVGRSGSGKSTLLHLVAGLDRPTEGQVIVYGQDIGALDDDAATAFRRRHIGLVYQFFHLLPSLSAEENVALPLLLDGKRGRAVALRVDEMLTAVAMEGRRRHRPAQLSGGEMQRVAIARALVAEPRVLLADEPTGNLDTEGAREILTLIQQSTRQSGLTVLLVTHDAAAASFADRVVRLQDGRIAGEDRSIVDRTVAQRRG